MKNSFKEAYGVLQRHAQTLRDQSEPNIDDLLKLVEESVAAYKVCQTRIDAVEKALEKALGETAPDAGSGKGKSARSSTPPEPQGDDADDPPF